MALAVDLCLLPRDLRPLQLIDHAVVVFDVLRATTSITAALDVGVSSIRVFPSTADAAKARSHYPDALLCGEERCLAPPGFDLGNSPRAFEPSLHTNRELLLSTTNGTRAILAARGAARMYAGALINAGAVARLLANDRLPVTLVCAGTDGAVALEDLIGAGAVIESLKSLARVELASDAALLAERVFASSRDQLPAVLRQTRGGLNLIAAGLEADIDFVARLNVVDTVGIVNDASPPVITRFSPPPADSQSAIAAPLGSDRSLTL